VDFNDADDGMDASAALSAGDAMAIIGAGVVGRVGGELGMARAASSSVEGAMSGRAKARACRLCNEQRVSGQTSEEVPGVQRTYAPAQKQDTDNVRSPSIGHTGLLRIDV
jgi:hypothetical protein